MIREIKFDDLKKIYLIGNEYDIEFSRKYILENYINNANYLNLCYEEDGIIKGFVISNILYENIEILLVYVDKEYRKCGIATKLFNKLFSYDIENILLEVSVENSSALSLYKKMGFEVIGTRKKYYNGIDALVMKKVLK